MGDSIRQQKVSKVLMQELAQFFRQEARTIAKGAMISVTEVKVTTDLKIAKVYLSIFASPNKKDLLADIKKKSAYIRGVIGKPLGKQLRSIPELFFYLDDSIDKSAEIDRLLAE